MSPEVREERQGQRVGLRVRRLGVGGEPQFQRGVGIVPFGIRQRVVRDRLDQRGERAQRDGRAEGMRGARGRRPERCERRPRRSLPLNRRGFVFVFVRGFK